MLNFIRAERTADWTLHIATVVAMLPHFHAAGHLLYAKSAHLYVQQMSELEYRMPKEQYERYTRKGYFTVRRSDRFWSGIWSDMCIEQVLMRSLKTTGGLTHGRGITENTLSQWILCAPACIEMTEAIQTFTETLTTTTEQHVELRQGRQSRDSRDRQRFVDWLKQHNLFANLPEVLICLSSGLVADTTVTCDQAVTIGTAAMKKLAGSNFHDVHLRRKDKVVVLATFTSAVKIRDELVVVNPQQLFNRIICVAKCPNDLQSYFAYELAPRPPSLFDDVSLRKGTKSSLVSAFKPEETGELSIPSNARYILDGGNLLHSIVWPRPATYSHVLDVYVSHVLNHYSSTCTVVFDGYPNYPTTKGEEQRRRSANKKTSPVILFEDNMPTTTQKADFLANTYNKKSFIEALTIRLKNVGVTVQQAEADADVLIVSTALQETAENGVAVVVVGQDTDLLVLLMSFAKPKDDAWFLRPGTGNKPCSVFSITRQRELLGDNCKNLLFVHAMTGCDTTSAIYRKGKVQVLKLLEKNKKLQNVVHVFNQQNATKNDIAAAGEQLFLSLYGAQANSTLDNHRYFAYNRATAKLSLQSKFDLATLPPTSAAAKQHSYRVYMQVQEWMGNHLEPTEWGWKLVNGSLLPVPTMMDPAPNDLLNLISCNCKSSCRKNCDCKRAGLECSTMCGQCVGISCDNSSLPSLDISDNEDDCHVASAIS